MAPQIETQCSDCNGTGVYSGCSEPVAVGVVCVDCNGTGKKVIEYVPFIGIQRRDDIRTVRISEGFGVREVSYEEFFASKVL